MYFCLYDGSSGGSFATRCLLDDMFGLWDGYFGIVYVDECIPPVLFPIFVPGSTGRQDGSNVDWRSARIGRVEERCEGGCGGARACAMGGDSTWALNIGWTRQVGTMGSIQVNVGSGSWNPSRTGRVECMRTV